MTTWFTQPMEFSPGKWRMCAWTPEEADENGNTKPHSNVKCDHASMEEAQACEACDRYVKRTAGVPTREEDRAALELADRQRMRRAKVFIAGAQAMRELIVRRFMAGNSEAADFGARYAIKVWNPAWGSDPGRILDADLPDDLPALIDMLVAEQPDIPDVWTNVGWRDAAEQYHRNECWLRSLLVEIGNTFGKEAYTADTGDVFDEVLVVKLPQLVKQLHERLSVLGR